MIEIKVVPYTKLAELEKEWKDLECGAEMTAFQLYDWYKNINNLLNKERTKNLFRELIYVVAQEKGHTIMIAPIQVIKFSLKWKTLGIRKDFI